VCSHVYSHLTAASRLQLFDLLFGFCDDNHSIRIMFHA
jgi:hypothetical protein